MTKAEIEELDKIVQEFSKNGYIVAAETGQILNNGKYIPIIRTVVMHEKTQKYVVTMYRDSPSNYKKWLLENIDKFITAIQKQIIEEKPKSNLILPGMGF